MTIDRKSIF